MKRIVITCILTLIVTLAVLFITPCFFGYHLVYIQKYSFDLGSMERICSIIFGLLGTLGTVSAVWVAIRIPKKIAQQQNRIALFEKRYETYYKVERIVNVVHDKYKTISEHEQNKSYAITNPEEEADFLFAIWVSDKQNFNDNLKDCSPTISKVKDKIVLNRDCNHSQLMLLQHELFIDLDYINKCKHLFNSKHISLFDNLGEKYNDLIFKLFDFYSNKEIKGFVKIRDEFLSVIDEIEDKNLLSEMQKQLKF